MATEVIGGKKISIALEAIGRKIAKEGLGLRVGFLENSTYAAAAARKLKRYDGKAPKTAKAKRTQKRLVNALLSTNDEGEALHVATVAFWDEFGTSTAPARPFFRTTIKEKSSDWAQVFAASLKHYNMNGEKALKALGQVMRDDVENAIAQWDSPPNSPSTVAKKGFDKPLVDRGIMQRAVDYEVGRA